MARLFRIISIDSGNRGRDSQREKGMPIFAKVTKLMEIGFDSAMVATSTHFRGFYFLKHSSSGMDGCPILAELTAIEPADADEADA